MIQGVVGHVKWAYYNAAAINGYVVVPDKGGRAWSLSATVVLSNAYNMAQRPLWFVAPMTSKTKGRIEVRWPIETFLLTDGSRLTARLGRPIREHR